MIRRAGKSPVLRELGRISAVRPSLSAAVRAALATGLPLLGAHALDQPGLVWASVGGFLAALVDRGGSYTARAVNLAAVAAAGAAAATLGVLLGRSPVTAVLAMLVWGTAASFLRVYGPVGLNTGLTSSVTLIVSLGVPAGATTALERGGWLLAGGAGVALLALSLWPLRRQVPASAAVARCYRALSAYAAHIAVLVQRGGGEQGPAGRGFDGVRRALEEGWGTLGAGWARRPARAPTTDRLLVLLESADQMLGALFALSDVAERVPATGRRAISDALRALAAHAESLADAVERDGGRAPPRPDWGELEDEEESAAEGEERLALRRAGELLRTLREFAAGAGDVLQGEHRPPGMVPAPQAGERGWGAWVDPIRNNLSGESVLLRHAIRVGVTSAVALAIGRATDLEHGYWIPLTVLFILQPYAGLTLVKGLQRVAGTVLGGVVAALIPLAVRDPLVLLVLISLLASAAVVTLPVNYALFAFFVTPTFVLLAELNRGTRDLAGTRVLNTVIGGVLAVAGARLLWSVPERRLFPSHAAAAFRAAREYLLALAEAPGREADRVAALRRHLGLEIIGLGESLQRLVLEEGEAAQAVEPARTMLVYLRRLASAEVALATSPPLPSEAAAVRRFVAAADRVLASLADAVVEQRRPPPFQPLIDGGGCPPRLRAELERIDRPIRVLHGAATRLAGASPWSRWD